MDAMNGEEPRLPGRSVAVVVAHPNDDAYGIAGSIALHAGDPGFRFLLVHATDGEAGDIAPGFPATQLTLGPLRRSECERAWLAHGRPPDRHEWLGYPDGGLAGVPFAELVGRISDILAEERPDVVCTFGPDGISGHPDHITVGRAADEAFALLRDDTQPGFRRLLHAAVKNSTLRRWNVSRVRDGVEPWDPDQIYHLRGVPDETIAIDVDTRSVADRTLAGLREHRSQRHVLFDRHRTDDQWLRVLGREYLVQAWPPRNTTDPVLHDIFEGFDPAPAQVQAG
jgi:LmbE family N-acetylglucosaminyl deacetylase